MRPHYVLVDFENVQPRNLGLLRGGGFRIKVFLGSQQGKLELEFVKAMQAFGEDAEYVQMAGNGKNALDFHLAYFLGKLSAEHPGAAFSIISNDTGFDPLVRYLKAQGIDCKRSGKVTDIPHLKSQAEAAGTAAAAPQPAPARKAASPARGAAAARPAPAPAKPSAATQKPAPAATPSRPARKASARAKAPAFDPARLELVLQNLRKRDKGLPKTLRTLRSTVASLLVKPAAREGEADALLAELQRVGKVAVDGNRVDYSLG
jgi:hypothetical protein